MPSTQDSSTPVQAGRHLPSDDETENWDELGGCNCVSGKFLWHPTDWRLHDCCLGEVSHRPTELSPVVYSQIGMLRCCVGAGNKASMASKRKGIKSTPFNVRLPARGAADQSDRSICDHPLMH
jgi:hypothetical protein